MPGMDGFTLLAEIRACRPDTPTLLITGHGERDLAGKALRCGACDFVQKPIDREYFVASLRRAIQMNEASRQLKQQQLTLERRADELERTVQERTYELQEVHRVVQSPLKWLMAPSQQMAKVVEQIKQVAASPLMILVEGETGTGKELVARAIHQLSARREQPFIPIDCGTISDAPCESGLSGRFQLAQGGTLFLDEVVSLPLDTQSTLFGALRERQVQSSAGAAPIAASSVPVEPE